MHDISLDDLTMASFSGVVKTKFRIHLSMTEVMEFELIEIRAGRFATLAAGQPHPESFSLLFAAPPAPTLSQRMYRFEHDQLGRFDLFIVPVGHGHGVAHYEAVFNRPAKTD